MILAFAFVVVAVTQFSEKRMVVVKVVMREEGEKEMVTTVVWVAAVRFLEV
jgi:hypothetical protein